MNCLSRLLFKSFEVKCDFSYSYIRAKPDVSNTCNGTFRFNSPKRDFTEIALRCDADRLKAQTDSAATTGYVLRAYPPKRPDPSLTGYPFPVAGAGEGKVSGSLSRWEYDAYGQAIPYSDFSLIDTIKSYGTLWFKVDLAEYTDPTGGEIIRAGYPPTWPMNWVGEGDPNINDPTQWQPASGFNNQVVFSSRAAFDAWITALLAGMAPEVLYAGAPNDIGTNTPFFDMPNWAAFKAVTHGATALPTGNDYSRITGRVVPSNTVTWNYASPGFSDTGELGTPPAFIYAEVGATEVYSDKVNKFGAYDFLRFDNTQKTTLYSGFIGNLLFQLPYYGHAINSRQQRFEKAGFPVTWYVLATSELEQYPPFFFGPAKYDTDGNIIGFEPCVANFSKTANSFAISLNNTSSYGNSGNVSVALNYQVSWENLVPAG